MRSFLLQYDKVSRKYTILFYKRIIKLVIDESAENLWSAWKSRILALTCTQNMSNSDKKFAENLTFWTQCGVKYLAHDTFIQ